jgi:Predicted ATPases of PP-loop superfamily
MKFVALVSGGKDSFYSIMECIRNGHELVACAHLSPRTQNGTDEEEEEEEEESYMYQTAASECIPIQVEQCLGVPLVMRQCIGRSDIRC